MQKLSTLLRVVAPVVFLAGCTTSDPIVPLPDEIDSGLPPGSEDMATPPSEDMARPQPDLRSVSDCSTKPMAMPGTRPMMMMSGGKQRTYFLHVPAKYDSTKPTALVLAFHGLSSKADSFLKYIDIEREADAHNVIALVPQGLGLVPGWNAGKCCGEPQLLKVDDVGFARDLIEATKKDFCVDEKRIYATGFSNGGMFSHRLACELSGVLAAVGPVSGGPMFPECKPDHPISILHLHGNADPTVAYHGGGIFPDIPMSIDEWAKRNGCTGAARETYKNGDVTCVTYETCAEKSEVSLCTVDKGAHTWPGSANGTPDLKGTAAILDFFAKHSR
jgi:polyhydroxybutyrate depolymerase